MCNIEHSSKALQIEEDVRNNICLFGGLYSGLRDLQRPSYMSGQNLPPPRWLGMSKYSGGERVKVNSQKYISFSNEV